MRHVDRGDEAAPAILSKKFRARGAEPAKTELERAREHIANTDPKKGSFDFKRYKEDDVKRRLEALFHGKCAYCEAPFSATQPVDVEHYRPKGAVQGDPDHPGYWWLAMDWENLLPSCIDCNRRRKQITPKRSFDLVKLHEGAFSASQQMQTGKKDAFPIAGVRAMTEAASLTEEKSNQRNEEAVLIDPTRNSPEDFLDFYVDRENLISLVLPRRRDGGEVADAVPLAGGDVDPEDVADDANVQRFSVRGAVSIQVYGLNRLGLVQDRTRLLRKLEFLEYLAVELSSIADELDEPQGGASPTPGNRRIASRLRQLRGEILEEMLRMAEPTEPYSVLAAEWIKGFRARLEH